MGVTEMEIRHGHFPYFLAVAFGTLLFLLLAIYIVVKSFKAKRINTIYFWVSFSLNVLLLVDSILLILWEFTYVFSFHKSITEIFLSSLLAFIDYTFTPVGIAVNFSGGVLNRFAPELPVTKYDKYRKIYLTIGCIGIIGHVIFYFLNMNLLTTGIKAIVIYLET